MPQQPNLLIVMTDQHSPHVLGCSGDRLARTPTLDRMYERGVRFQRTYCGNPLCVPSRMTFLTGQHCSDIGVWSNCSTLRSDIPTFLHALAAAGYHTVLCGRMHFHCADHRHGFAEHLVGDVSGQWPGTIGPKLGHIPLNTTGQDRPAVETAGPGRTSYQAFDRAVTDAALNFLTEEREDDRPFCLVVGYVLPHCPFICPKPLYDEFYPRVDIPRMPEAEQATLHPAMQAWRKNHGVNDLSDEQVRRARAAYYGLVTMCDRHVGELLSALDQTGLADDTALFYTSDHGDMAGEHEMWWKSSFYEGSVSVPLIASWPGHFAEGAVVTHPVSLLDLAPTVVELGQADPLPHASGQSLTPFLQERQSHVTREADVFSECSGGRGDPPARMIVRGPWKLIHYHGYQQPQLFNLETDPDEICDLRNDPASRNIRDELHARVLQDWSGDRIVQALDKEKGNWEVLTAWSTATQPPTPDHWEEPTDRPVNIFPEN